MGFASRRIAETRPSATAARARLVLTRGGLPRNLEKSPAEHLRKISVFWFYLFHVNKYFLAALLRSSNIADIRGLCPARWFPLVFVLATFRKVARLRPLVTIGKILGLIRLGGAAHFQFPQPSRLGTAYCARIWSRRASISWSVMRSSASSIPAGIASETALAVKFRIKPANESLGLAFDEVWRGSAYCAQARGRRDR